MHTQEHMSETTSQKKKKEEEQREGVEEKRHRDRVGHSIRLDVYVWTIASEQATKQTNYSF